MNKMKMKLDCNVMKKVRYTRMEENFNGGGGAVWRDNNVNEEPTDVTVPVIRINGSCTRLV